MNTDSSYPKWLYCLGLIPTIWLALLIAPSVNGGLPQIMKDFSDVIGNPFHITWCDSSIKVIIIFIIGYVMAITIYLSQQHQRVVSLMIRSGIRLQVCYY